MSAQIQAVIRPPTPFISDSQQLVCLRVSIGYPTRAFLFEEFDGFICGCDLFFTELCDNGANLFDTDWARPIFVATRRERQLTSTRTGIFVTPFQQYAKNSVTELRDVNVREFCIGLCS